MAKISKRFKSLCDKYHCVYTKMGVIYAMLYEGILDLVPYKKYYSSTEYIKRVKYIYKNYTLKQLEFYMELYTDKYTQLKLPLDK